MRSTARIVLACSLLGALGTVTPARADGMRYRDPIFASANVTRGLPYGQAVDNNGTLVPLLLDIYMPNDDPETARAAIVFAHGGGFTGGDRADRPL